MARYTGPKSKIARKFGAPIYGEDKVLARKNFPPGQHGNSRRRKTSEYGNQLKEKQKTKYTYGVLERQFRNLFEKAARTKGITGEVLLQLLESRLDNIAYRLGMAPTRPAARQLVLHKHVTVNGQVVNIPSYRVKPGDVVCIREKDKSLEVVAESLNGFNHAKYPWLEWDATIMGGKYLHLPAREDIPEEIQEQLIVELYSKELEQTPMAILAFQKPDNVIMLNASDSYGKFEFRPLEPGYGQTIGNALRRILLSSLGGFAICSIKIDGVSHELDTIPGVKEDVTNIILNLKQVRFRQKVEDHDTETAVLEVKGMDRVTAGDLGKVLSSFEVLNPELEICRLNPDYGFRMEFTINKGRSWVPADENREMIGDQIGVIAIDSIYTPIKNVKYTVENFRVEQKTDYEKLILEVTTDGSIKPKDALKEASRILIYHLQLFTDDKITVDVEASDDSDEFDEDALKMRQLLKSKLVDMDLSVRALNCLKSAEVETLGDLVKYNKIDLLKFRNFGRKSLTELDELLANLNLSFGMDISNYKLDKD